MSYELDPKNPDTLINQPAPNVPDWFHKALEQLGGKQLDGTPNLRVVWGQEERRFACGRERIKYPTSFAAEKADYQFRLVSVDTGEGQDCTFGEFMEAKKQYDAVDPDLKFVPQYKVKRHVEWIGYPRFIIEQYEPVVMLRDTVSGWESHRYGWWFNPETVKQEWTDIIGPFPFNGRYNHFLTVKEDDGTEHGRYCAPSEREIELVRQAIQARENYKPVSAEFSVKQIIEEKEKALQRSESEIAEQIENELAPHVSKMFETQVRFYQSGKGK
jgi:hypothetical protein